MLNVPTFNPFDLNLRGLPPYYEFVRWNGLNYEYLGSDTSKLNRNEIYRVLATNIGNFSTLYQLQEISTGRIMPGCYNSVLFTPLTGFQAFAKNKPELNKQYKVYRIIADGNKLAMESCTTSPVRAIIGLSENLCITLTKNSLYVVQILD